MADKIATEQEAKTKLGFDGSVIANKCCTKARAEQMGADVSSLSSYTSNRLVTLSKIQRFIPSSNMFVLFISHCDPYEEFPEMNPDIMDDSTYNIMQLTISGNSRSYAYEFMRYRTDYSDSWEEGDAQNTSFWRWGLGLVGNVNTLFYWDGEQDLANRLGVTPQSINGTITINSIQNRCDDISTGQIYYSSRSYSTIYSISDTTPLRLKSTGEGDDKWQIECDWGITSEDFKSYMSGLASWSSKVQNYNFTYQNQLGYVDTDNYVHGNIVLCYAAGCTYNL